MPTTEVGYYKVIKRATVAIASMNPEGKTPFTIFGSGFCIDKEGIIITCEHVLSSFMTKSIPKQIADLPNGERIQNIGHIKMEEPFVLFYKIINPKQLGVYPCHIERACALTDVDLCAIKVHASPFFPDGYPTIEIEDYENISEGAEVGTCGFPLGNFLYDQLGTVSSSFTKGIISSIIPTSGVGKDHVKGFQLNVTATHGNSGGPVFLISTGKVFGVLQRGVINQKSQFIHGLVNATPIFNIFKNDLIQRMKEAEPGNFPRMK